jgi:hypothetical protein
MYQQETLRGVVMNQYRTITAFARAIGWSYSKAYRIINGKQIPDSTDIQEFCRTVGLTDPGRIARIFSLC